MSFYVLSLNLIIGEPIIVYSLNMGNTTLFHECVATKTESHNAEFIANDFMRVVATTPENVICSGGTFDNCAANKAAWRILEGAFPDKFFIGCIAHGGHLMVGDIIAKMPGYKNSIASANENKKRGRETVDLDVDDYHNLDFNEYYEDPGESDSYDHVLIEQEQE